MGLWSLESVAAGVWDNPCATLLETQDGQVLNYLPKGLQAKAKAQLNEISMGEGRAAADQALDHFLLSYEAKYPKAPSVCAKIGKSC